jgi:hypothetical protein
MMKKKSHRLIEFVKGYRRYCPLGGGRGNILRLSRSQEHRAYGRKIELASFMKTVRRQKIVSEAGTERPRRVELSFHGKDGIDWGIAGKGLAAAYSLCAYKPRSNFSLGGVSSPTKGEWWCLVFRGESVADFPKGLYISTERG